MSVDGIEAFADAIMDFEGWHPLSRSYVNRNPGNLRSGKLVDKEGYNIYSSLLDGYRALTVDLRAKFTDGKNTHGLGQKSTLLDLMKVYSPMASGNPTNEYTTFIANWLTKVFGRSITTESKLEEIWLCPNFSS
jgi:hypothetical protein